MFNQLSFLDKLQDYHRLFYGVFELGEPVFTEKVDTAAVAFNESTGKVDFLINKSFFESLSAKEQLFLVCHEALHVVFSHIERVKKFSLNPHYSNVAQDIVINELLCREFGFIKEDLDICKEACFVDSVFSKTDIAKYKIVYNGSFEYYYDLLLLIAPKRLKVVTIDLHDISDLEGEYSTVPEEVADSLVKVASESMSSDELKTLVKSLSDPLNDKIKSAGVTGLGSLYGIELTNVKQNRSWESIVKNKVSTLLKRDERNYETFLRKPRRLTCLQDNLFLPEFLDYEEDSNDKFNLYFFLDASGSCISYKNKFFNLVRSIPQDKFNITLFSFDTEVYKLDLKKPIVRGGGGTSFSPMEKTIQSELKTQKTKYPDLVFVLTDGYGSHINPEKPKNWFWLMTEDYTTYIPKGSNYVSLNSFSSGDCSVKVAT